MALQAAGLKEGGYIVSVNGQPCRWWKHAEVVAQLKSVGDEGVSLQVATLLPSAEAGPVSPRGLGGGPYLLGLPPEVPEARRTLPARRGPLPATSPTLLEAPAEALLPESCPLSTAAPNVSPRRPLSHAPG